MSWVFPRGEANGVQAAAAQDQTCDGRETRKKSNKFLSFFEGRSSEKTVFFFHLARSPHQRHRQDRQWRPRRQREFSSTRPRRCSAPRRSHGALQGDVTEAGVRFSVFRPFCYSRSARVSPYRGISSRCSASALRSHRGKPRHRRRGPRTLAASAGRLHRKSCCSCSRWSRRASVHRLREQAP